MSKYKINSNNYYERLGLDPNSWSTITQEQIKDAFFDAVKIYPPQKEAEKFKLLREAYDTLNNKISRDEYNSENEYGEELKKLKEELEEAEKDEQINNQILILKKILIMQNKSCNYRNKLGLAYDSNEEYLLAIKQFELAIDINPDNSSYYINIGGSYESLKKYDDALNYYYKAHELDDENHTPPIRIAQILFHNKKQKTKAYDILEKAINADGKIDFLDFFTIFTKTRMYAFDKRKIKLKEELKRIESIAKSDADKDIASYLLINESKMLSGYGLNDIAIKYAETANRLVDLDDYSKGIFNIIQEFTKIEKLRKINKFFKIFLSGRLSYYFGIDPPVGIDEMSKLFINQMQSDPANTTIKKNIDYIELEFPNIYEMLGDSFPGMVRDFPAAYYYASDCPGSSCKQRYQIEKSAASAEYYCDKCSTSYKWDYTNNKFKISFSGGGGSSSDCFVAGAVYQSDIHPQVLFLRNFRDTILRKYFFGRLFIKFYYLFGPYGALVIKKNTFLIKYVKDYLLEPLIRIIKKIV